MKEFDPKKHALSQFLFAHYKRDGWNVTVTSAGNGDYKAMTRAHNSVDLSWLPVDKTLRTLAAFTLVRGELWFPGKPASYVSTALSKRIPGLKFEAFCILDQHVGPSAPLTIARMRCEGLGLEFIPYLTSLNEQIEGRALWDHTLPHTPADMLAMGIEGFVLKNSNEGDEHVKWKPSKTCDLRVVGHNEGKGKYFGMVGSLICADGNGIVRCAISGMTDEEREQFTNLHFEGKLDGLLVEVKYQKVEAKGGLRHPQFLRVRVDKNEADTEIL